MHLLLLNQAAHLAGIPGNLLPLLLPLAFLELILVVFALVDLIRREPERVRGSKVVWVLIILFISTLGPICYFIVGRKEV